MLKRSGKSLSLAHLRCKMHFVDTCLSKMVRERIEVERYILIFDLERIIWLDHSML